MIFAIFVAYPFLAALVGAGLLGLGVKSRSRFLSYVGVLWCIYSLYEYGMKARILCTGECNIRVDLLLIYPALLGATVVGIVRAVRKPRSGTPSR